MKTILILITGLLCGTCYLIAESPEQFFIQGNEAYQQDNYTASIDQYTQALQEQASVALLYNLGNAYFKNNQPGYAVLSYSQALFLDPMDADARANLAFVREAEGLKAPPVSQLREYSQKLNINTWAWLLTASFWIMVFLFVFQNLFSWQGMVSYSLITLFALCICLSFVGLWGYHLDRNLGVVLGKESPLKVAPTDKSPVITYLFPGTIAVALKSAEDFLLVKTAEGREGWIDKDGFAKIYDPS